MLCGYSGVNKVNPAIALLLRAITTICERAVFMKISIADFFDRGVDARRLCKRALFLGSSLCFVSILLLSPDLSLADREKLKPVKTPLRRQSSAAMLRSPENHTAIQSIFKKGLSRSNEVARAARRRRLLESVVQFDQYIFELSTQQQSAAKSDSESAVVAEARRILRIIEGFEKTDADSEDLKLCSQLKDQFQEIISNPKAALTAAIERRFTPQRSGGRLGVDVPFCLSCRNRANVESK